MRYRRWIAVFLLMPGMAHAHAAFVGAGDFYAGALHPLTSPEHILLLLVCGLWLGQQGRSRSTFSLAWFPLAALAGAFWSQRFDSAPDITSWVVAVALLMGALLALAKALPRSVLLLLVLLAGGVYGFANGGAREGQMAVYPFIAGVVLAAFLVLAYLLVIADHLWRQPAGWIRIALRVLGSWAVAISMLTLTLAARGMVSL